MGNAKSIFYHLSDHLAVVARFILIISNCYASGSLIQPEKVYRTVREKNNVAMCYIFPTMTEINGNLFFYPSEHPAISILCNDYC